MQHGQISKFRKAFLAFATLGLAAACGESNVAPTTQVAAFKAPAAFDVVVGVQTFLVNNSEGKFQRIGDHMIYIPAGAVCDPLLSTYGSTEWDKPCTALRGSIAITATSMRDKNNLPYVDFQPALRFAPAKQVMLFLRNGRSEYASQLYMKFCDNLGTCVDESMADATLKPFRVGNTSVIGRRVKHFSGYMIAMGDACAGTVTQEPDGTWMCNDEGMARRSGYMVASGNDEKDKDEEKDGR